MGGNFLKKYNLVVFLLIAMIVLAACGKSANTTQDKPAGDTGSNSSNSTEKFVLKLAHGFPTTAYHHTHMEWFAEEVKKRSNGQLTIQLFPSGQLMPPDQEAPAMLQGQIDMSHSSSPVLAGFDPVWNVYELPFIFKYDPKDPTVFLENRIKFNNSENGGQKIAKLMEDKGLKVLAFSFVDMFGSVFTTDTENMVSGPDSAKGLRLRTPGGMIGPETVKAIGASSMTIAGAEVITALQQKVVDGLLTTPIYAHDAKLPVKSFSVVPVFNSITPVIMSAKKFNSLPENLQKILVETGKDLEEYSKKVVGEKALTVYKNMEAEGIKIYYPSEKEMTEWEEATKPARELFETKVDGGKELLEELSSIK